MSGGDVEAPAEWQRDGEAPGWFGGFFGFLGVAGHDGVGVVGGGRRRWLLSFFGSGADGYVVARGWKTFDIFDGFGGDALNVHGEGEVLVLL